MQVKLVAVFLVLALGSSAAIYAFLSETSHVLSQGEETSRVEVTTDDKSPVELKAEIPEARPKPAPKKKLGPFTLEEENSTISADRLQLPNGKSVPILNGAYGAPKLGWPAEIPYSPIIKVELDGNGLRWYIHEDGSRSITQNISDSVSGKSQPVTQVYNPTDPVPMDPGEIDRVMKDRDQRKRSRSKQRKRK